MSELFDTIFPSVRHSIESFIEDEEGSIPRNKLMAIGTIVAVMSVLFCSETLAAHRSHSSHSSHASHSSTSYHRSHNSHSNHGSHVSHGSHTSHSNSISHSNSNYSANGDLGTPKAPAVKSVPRVEVAPIANDTSMQIPDINTDISAPQASVKIGTLPALAVPRNTPHIEIPSTDVHTPPVTPTIETPNKE